jgi:4-hydroxy-2-oxoheptanedioate aldolase
MRTSHYGGASQSYYDDANRHTRCFPMIESAEALVDVEAILALPTVDGVFVGPSDLSLSRGRGAYSNTEADRADITRIAEAAAAAHKAWIMPGWTKSERDFARPLKPVFSVVVDEGGALYTGLSQALATV